MKSITFTARKGAILAVAGALLAFAGGASAACTGVVPGAKFPPYDFGPLTSAYELFVMSETPVVVRDVADDGYGSQGFHHGLPETSMAPGVEPVAGGAEAMREAEVFTYTPNADYGSRGIEHWMPNYYQAD